MDNNNLDTSSDPEQDPELEDGTSIASKDEESFEAWSNNWGRFVCVFTSYFGPTDAEGDAKNKLDNLRMKEDKKVLHYNLWFKEYFAQVDWGPKALAHRYYKGLASRIKNKMAHVQHPSDLRRLRKLAREINARYWQRQEEKHHENRDALAQKQPLSTPSTNNKSQPSQNKTSTPRSALASSSSTPNASASSSAPKSLTPVLGCTADGRLTQEERQRHIDNKLCMVCGKSGHFAKDCKKAKTNKKACAAKASTLDAPSTGSKKE
jgi:hypothetical protein